MFLKRDSFLVILLLRFFLLLLLREPVPSSESPFCDLSLSLQLDLPQALFSCSASAASLPCLEAQAAFREQEALVAWLWL